MLVTAQSLFPLTSAATIPVQLRLFPAASPLVARFGAEFFRGLPRQPGVYLMRDAADRLIYVGKAKNLRQRLNSYRYAQRASRKTVRLLHSVHQIAWELCPSEPAARLRELELLRTHRPRFNRADTWPQKHCFMVLEPLSPGFRLRLTNTLADEVATPPVGQSVVFGAFKGARASYLALLRQLWHAIHPGAALSDLPRRLVQSRPPREFAIRDPTADAWLESLTAYLRGVSAQLVAALVARLPTAGTTFERQFRQADLTTLEEFFAYGPRRNHEYCQRVGRDTLLVAQEELDQLPARTNLDRSPPHP